MIGTALFVVVRAIILAIIAFGLLRSPSLGFSLTLFFGLIFMACDTVRVLVEARRRP